MLGKIAKLCLWYDEQICKYMLPYTQISSNKKNKLTNWSRDMMIIHNLPKIGLLKHLGPLYGMTRIPRGAWMWMEWLLDVAPASGQFHTYEPLRPFKSEPYARLVPVDLHTLWILGQINLVDSLKIGMEQVWLRANHIQFDLCTPQMLRCSILCNRVWSHLFNARQQHSVFFGTLIYIDFYQKYIHLTLW